MAQLSLYLEEKDMEMLRNDAMREGLSLSKYASRIIREHAGNNKWPAGYWETVYGSLNDSTYVLSDDDLDATLDGPDDLFE